MSTVTEKPQGRTARRPSARGTASRATVVRNSSVLPVSDTLAPAPPMGYRGRKPVRVVKALGWKSPEAIAVLIASFVVSLACFYVAAYARVTAEGFEKLELTKQLRAVKAERESLEADISRLTSGGHVTQKAQTLGLTLAPKAAVVQVGNGASGSSLPTIQAAETEATASEPLPVSGSPPTKPTTKPIVESVDSTP